jgi:hypothetical protein
MIVPNRHPCFQTIHLKHDIQFEQITEHKLHALVVPRTDLWAYGTIEQGAQSGVDTT